LGTLFKFNIFFSKTTSPTDKTSSTKRISGFACKAVENHFEIMAKNLKIDV